MKFDDASWHYGGNFPKDLPAEAGATHTGMFVAWAMLSGLAGEMFVNDSPDELERLSSRSCTPGEFFLNSCDGKFVDEDLNEMGNAFAESYFNFEKGQYLRDYEQILGKSVPTLYHIKDSWENFDCLKPTLDSRFAEWKRE
jgi:hypothetical protein